MATAPSAPPPPPATSPPRTSSPRLRLPANADLTPEEIDLVLRSLAENERGRSSARGAAGGKETWSRYLVENYFGKWKWYNPNLSDPAAPPLSLGWAFFEHFTLPRRFAARKGVRAPPGEAGETELYGCFDTPRSALSDWGPGVGMYFSTLAATCFVLVLVGTLNAANVAYYSSEEYDESEGSFFDLADALRYSAVCADREWVVCEDCAERAGWWDSMFAREFYGTASDGSGSDVTLISRTTCDLARFDQGMWNFGTLLLLILCIAVYMWYLSRLELRYDEDNSSAPDYTVVVRNPPRDAYDPEEWKHFFEKYSDKQVTLCTIALNNERLLKKLVLRRQDMKTLRGRLGADTDFQNAEEIGRQVQAATEKRAEGPTSCIGKLSGCTVTPIVRIFGFGRTETELWERIQSTTEEIKALQAEEYHVSAVYITFETEQGQRTALEATNASRTELLSNTAMSLDPTALFRGQVLNVEEASEPSAVRWLDLDYSVISMNTRVCCTFGATLALVALSAVILHFCRTRVNTWFYAVILSTLNFIIPFVVRIMVSSEKHYDDGSMQRSLYIKITLFRWMNTVIITRIITPFVATLGVDKIDMINTVNALLISEMLLSPLLRYFDIFTILDRHYFAPRANTLEELYSCFNGGWYNLAERFTDFTKILLLAIFYSPFIPLIYFLSAMILFIQYWMDKFLLLRSWQQAPLVGTESARFSRTYFTTAAVVIGAISSAYAYFHSPFTQLCDCPDGESCPLPGTTFTDVELLNGTVVDSIEVSTNETVKFCNQNLRSFPPVPSKQGADQWMTPSQIGLTSIYGLFALILLIAYLVILFGMRVLKFITVCWKGGYEPHGVDQRKDFSSCIGIETFGYIPQLTVPGIHFPLLACDIDEIDVKLINWRNPNAPEDTSHPHMSYDDYNLIFDVPYKGMKRDKNVVSSTVRSGEEQEGATPIFSIVKHWPPEWAKNKQE